MSKINDNFGYGDITSCCDSQPYFGIEWWLVGDWQNSSFVYQTAGLNYFVFFMNFMIAYSLLNGELFSSEGFWSRSVLQRYNFSKVLVNLGSFLSISKIAFSSP